jgi:hypothetical protein
MFMYTKALAVGYQQLGLASESVLVLEAITLFPDFSCVLFLCFYMACSNKTRSPNSKMEVFIRDINTAEKGTSLKLMFGSESSDPQIHTIQM